ncbi:hypothetical protein SAMN04488109_6466 [Chryseolinea serpens]|uniref:YhhN-like protein n=2 Tax=Chryseolinea serpens TaxID=947013 RepID=A0A1M5XEJ4_9BACT|nr:hypothetical protein SAMN04488109_6466 [Chryseolinea serpens]
MLLGGLIVVLSWVHFKRRSIEIKLIGLNFVPPILGYFSLGLFNLRGLPVNIPQNIETCCHFVILWNLYYFGLQKRYTRMFVAVFIVFSIFAFVNAFFGQKMYFNSYTVALSDVILIVYCVTYFYRLLVDLPAQHLQQLPMFWISAAFLIHAAGALFLYLFTAYLTQFFFNDVLIYWTFHNILNIFQEILILIGVAVDLKNVTSTRAAIKNI